VRTRTPSPPGSQRKLPGSAPEKSRGGSAAASSGGAAPPSRRAARRSLFWTPSEADKGTEAPGHGEGSQGNQEALARGTPAAARKGAPVPDPSNAGPEGGKEEGEKGRVQALEEEVQRLKARLAAYQAAGAAQQRFPLQPNGSPRASSGPLAPCGAPQAQQGALQKGPPAPDAPAAYQGEPKARRAPVVCPVQSPLQVAAVGKGLAELSLEDAGDQAGADSVCCPTPQGAMVYQGVWQGAGGEGGGGVGGVPGPRGSTGEEAGGDECDSGAVHAHAAGVRGGGEARLEVAVAAEANGGRAGGAGAGGTVCRVYADGIRGPGEGEGGQSGGCRGAAGGAGGERKVREMGVTASLYMQMLKEAESAGREARVEAQLLRRKVLVLEP